MHEQEDFMLQLLLSKRFQSFTKGQTLNTKSVNALKHVDWSLINFTTNLNYLTSGGKKNTFLATCLSEKWGKCKKETHLHTHTHTVAHIPQFRL